MLSSKLKFITILIVILTIILIIYFYSTPKTEQFLRIIEAVPQNSSKLFDLNFKYVLNNANLCSDSTRIYALILVTSYFGNVETRSAMRRAFPQNRLDQMQFRRIFLLGVSPEDKYTTQESVRDESRRFNDIVQGNFKEAYRNLTYKHTMGLKWVMDYCQNVEFVIKMDDDIVVNLRKLPHLLNELKPSFNDLFIAGYVLKNMLPIREPYNKWYVTSEEYKLTVYPTFVSGWFYITNPKTCIELFKLTSTTSYFWIDDTFITGILAEQLKIQHKNIREYFAVHSEFLDCCLNDMITKNLSCDILIGPNGGNNNLFYDFNEAVGKCEIEICEKRTKSLNETCVAEKKINLGRGDAVVEDYKLK